MILLLKKLIITVCDEYQTLRLLKYASEIMVRIIYGRIYDKISTNLALSLDSAKLQAYGRLY